MAVSVNATGTAGTGVATTTGFTEAAATITIAAGSNRVLCLVLQLSAKPTVNPTATWDTGGTNQIMTLVGAPQGESDNLGFCYIYGLIAPTTGAKLLKVSWVTTSATFTYCLVAYNGADQGSAGGTFRNFQSNNPASAASAVNHAYPTGGVNVKSPSGDFCILSAGSNNQGFALTTGGTGQVGTFIYGLNTNVSGGAVHTAGTGAATNLAVSALQNSNVAQPACWAACDIAALGAVAALISRPSRIIRTAARGFR